MFAERRSDCVYDPLISIYRHVVCVFLLVFELGSEAYACCERKWMFVIV